MIRITYLSNKYLQLIRTDLNIFSNKIHLNVNTIIVILLGHAIYKACFVYYCVSRWVA